MALHVGTSGWQYKEWKGSFYPEDLPTAKMLAYYGERFDSVEVNNTFYRMPSPDVLKGWAEQVPPGFSFVVKASQRITHRARLAGPDAADALAYLLKCCAELGERQGPVLYQTPPWLKKDVAVLTRFLALIPAGHRAAFEFRNASWFDDEVYEALAARNAALAVADTGGDGDPPLVRTADWGYARLRREQYPGDLLGEWADRLGSVGWDHLWVFKHEDEGTGPKLAARFRALAG